MGCASQSLASIIDVLCLRCSSPSEGETIPSSSVLRYANNHSRKLSNDKDFGIFLFCFLIYRCILSWNDRNKLESHIYVFVERLYCHLIRQFSGRDSGGGERCSTDEHSGTRQRSATKETLSARTGFDDEGNKV